jgi:hypothetical protein
MSDNKFKIKALGLSYVLSQLLIDNLDIVCLEIKNEPEYGQMFDKLTKLKSASRNAFRILEKQIGEEDYLQLKNDIELTLDELWGD